MKKRIPLILLVAGVVCSYKAGAQCLPLSQMAAVAADPSSAAKPEKVRELPASDWLYRGTPPKSREIQWASSATSASAEGTTVPAVFLLRPFQQGYDAVLKTTEASCVRQLRADLKSQKQAPIPVTCPGCEAVRYDGPSFQTTIYSNMKGEYPFIVVVHPLNAAPATITKQGGTSTAQ